MLAWWVAGSLLLAPTCGLLNHFLPLPALFRSTSLTLISFAKHKTLVQTQKGNVKNSAETLHILLPTTYIVWNYPPCPQNSWTAMFVFTVWQERLFGKMQLSGLLFWNAVQVRRSCHSSQLSAGCGSPCNLRCGKLEAVSRQNLGPPSPQPATDTIITLSTVAAINTLSFSLAWAQMSYI